MQKFDDDSFVISEIAKNSETGETKKRGTLSVESNDYTIETPLLIFLGVLGVFLFFAFLFPGLTKTSSSEIETLFSQPVAPAVNNHAELCRNEVSESVDTSFESHFNIVSDDAFTDESHKVVIKNDTSYDKAGLNNV